MVRALRSHFIFCFLLVNCFSVVPELEDMAFATKLGSLLKQSVTKHIRSTPSVYVPAIYNAFRCMSSKVFVGGLSYGIDDQTLRESFATFGDVMEARIINDRETGRSRGFGFVTFSSADEANAAVEAMDGKDLQGRSIRVNIAQERTGGGFGGGGGGYGGGGGGGYGGGGGGGW